MWNSYLIALQTILYREIKRIFRLWSQTFLPSLISTAIYLLIFGRFLGGHLDALTGMKYATYIIPGLVMMTIITNAYNHVCFSYFGAKFQNTVDELLVAPIPLQLIFWGYVAGGVLRGFLVGLLVMLMAACFSPFHIEHIGLTLISFLLCAILFSMAGFINALLAKTFDSLSMMVSFVLTPLTYLGGVFYSIDVLPPIWHKLSLFNPILYIVDSFRFGMIGSSDINAGFSLLMILVFVLIFYGIAMLMLRRGKGIRL